jgi:hypothetical protein
MGRWLARFAMLGAFLGVFVFWGVIAGFAVT